MSSGRNRKLKHALTCYLYSEMDKRSHLCRAMHTADHTQLRDATSKPCKVDSDDRVSKLDMQSQ